MRNRPKTSFESCGRKRIYFDEHEAKMARLRTLEKYGTRTDEYKCNVCGYWHLTRFYQLWSERKLADRHI